MNDLLFEFGSVALAHALAVASPGPDLALVLRQSLTLGRRAAVLSAIGIGCGILVHVAYSLVGVGALVRHQPTVFTVLKYAGAVYLAWLGWQALRARPSATAAPAKIAVEHTSDRGAWARGFFTNLLNPKATLFFIALFSLGIDPDTPARVQALYGLWMAAATAGWFSAVALVFTQPRVRQAYQRSAVWIDRALGAVFLGFAISLIWD